MVSSSTPPSILAQPTHRLTKFTGSAPQKTRNVRIQLRSKTKDGQEGDSTSFTTSPSSSSHHSTPNTPDSAEKRRLQQLALEQRAEFETNWRKHGRKLSTDAKEELSDPEEAVEANTKSFLANVAGYKDVQPVGGAKPVAALKQHVSEYQKAMPVAASKRSSKASRQSTFQSMSALLASLTGQSKKHQQEPTQGIQMSRRAQTFDYRPTKPNVPTTITKSATFSPDRKKARQDKSFDESRFFALPRPAKPESKMPISQIETLFSFPLVPISPNGAPISPSSESFKSTEVPSIDIDSDDEGSFVRSARKVDPTFSLYNTSGSTSPRAHGHTQTTGVLDQTALSQPQRKQTLTHNRLQAEVVRNQLALKDIQTELDEYTVLCSEAKKALNGGYLPGGDDSLKTFQAIRSELLEQQQALLMQKDKLEQQLEKSTQQAPSSLRKGGQSGNLRSHITPELLARYQDLGRAAAKAREAQKQGIPAVRQSSSNSSTTSPDRIKLLDPLKKRVEASAKPEKRASTSESDSSGYSDHIDVKPRRTKGG